MAHRSAPPLIVNGHARRAVASVVPQSLWPAAVTAGANPDWVDVPLVRLEPAQRHIDPIPGPDRRLRSRGL